MASPLDRIFDRVESAAALDPLAGIIAGLADRALPGGRVRDVLHGVPLGHPAHPMLTDLPIGFFTSASVLDLGGRRTAKAAERFVALGLLSSLPTAAAGLADWVALGEARRERRVGLVHIAANSLGLLAYASSWRARRQGRHIKGMATSLLGMSVMTVGGALGGHLAFRQKVGVSHAPGVPEGGRWTPVLAESELLEGVPTRADLDGLDLVLLRQGLTVRALAGSCSHLGGPLGEGDATELDGATCVVCPWHGSAFRVQDGAVMRGPATAPQPVYEGRLHAGQVQVRLRVPAPAPAHTSPPDRVSHLDLTAPADTPPATLPVGWPESAPEQEPLL